MSAPTGGLRWLHIATLGVCEVEGCRALLGGPRDTPTMCAECSTQIEEQEREERSEGGER